MQDMHDEKQNKNSFHNTFMKPLHENNIFLKVYKLKAVHDEMAKYVFQSVFCVIYFPLYMRLKR
jgi:hypothetical protein